MDREIENDDGITEEESEGRETTIGDREGKQGDQDRVVRLLTNTSLRSVHTK